MGEAEGKEGWMSIIRATLLTSKNPLTIDEIARDVRTLEGISPPFRTFKFKSLEEMVRAVPGLKVFNLGGKTVAQAVASQESEHISRFVRMQKSSKKKSRTMAPRMTNQYNYNMSGRRPTYQRFSQGRSNNVQNRYVPNRSTGHFSSQQSHSSYNNRSQQQQQQQQAQQQSNEQYRKTMTSPVTAPTAPSRQASASVTTQPTPKPQARTTPPPVKTATPTPSSPPTTTSRTSNLQQRLGTPVQTQSQAPNVQQRLNVQQPRAKGPAMQDPRLILENYVEARNLPRPIYKDVPSKDKNIYSSVTVNSKKYSSYPKEAKTKEDAEKLAAQAALAELLDKSNMPKVITQNRAEIRNRVLAIVNSHPNGIFESSLMHSYVAKHNEGLPPTWLKIVEHDINVDIGANELTILSPQDNSISEHSRSASPSLIEPPALNLNSLNEFWFRVYVVYNPNDVWGVIIGESNSDKINDLAIEMKHFYDINSAIPTSIVPDQYYAVLDSQNWHRVHCIEVDPDSKKATVFFIDRGDEDTFDLSELHDLSVKFCTLPAQAIQISLEGIEPFYGCAEMHELLEEAVLDKDIWVTVDSANSQENVPLSSRCYLQPDDQTIVDISQMLIDKFMAEFANPKTLMKPSKAGCEVSISEIRDKDIYVQPKSVGFRLFNEIMTNLAKDYLDVELIKPASNLDRTKLYLVKIEKKWMRIKVLKEVNDIAIVQCVDEGSNVEVQAENLVAIDGMLSVLAMFPHQAAQVALHKISPLMFDKKMAAHLRTLAPKEDIFYMKVVGDQSAIPRVELYKRTENNYLASLNDTLALEPEMSTKTDDNNNDKKSRLRNDRKSLTSNTKFPLKTPEIPPIGSYFDVYITMAAHPSNFTVQPFSTTNELKKLMTELSAVCSTYNGPLLTSSNVKIGSMYAAKYDNDGRWYRAYLSKIIGKNVCAVYFCDYGDYRAVPLEQLQPLANQFYDLPYQAIKAKLHGVTPKLKGDWTVKDSLRFNELVVEKALVSLVKAYDVDNTTPGEILLSLELIDTNGNEDRYIVEQLVLEKRAEKIEA